MKMKNMRPPVTPPQRKKSRSNAANGLLKPRNEYRLFFATLVSVFYSTLAWTPSSSFHGSQIPPPAEQVRQITRTSSGLSSLVMRKQKASNKRTARLQRGQIDDDVYSPSSFTPSPLLTSTSKSTATQVLSSSPMKSSQWKQKAIRLEPNAKTTTGDASNEGRGRGRARKRLKLYSSLASYHSKFLELISTEYQLEEAEVLARIESSASDPFSLEASGHALFDLHPHRRGNLFNDEVYRLEKAHDATTTFYPGGDVSSDFAPESSMSTTESSGTNTIDTNTTTNIPRPNSQITKFSPLPPNHKFARNDVIVITLQPRGTGDFIGSSSLPTHKDAVLVEARVLNVGPHYLDVAVPAGKYESVFGPASNNVGEKGKGDPNLRVRVDKFFSDVPYKRMVAALGQLTSVQQHQHQVTRPASSNGKKHAVRAQMDNVLKDVILSTFTSEDETNSMLDGATVPPLGDLPKRLAKPPLPTSAQLANQVLTYIQANPSQVFPAYNEPQLTSIRAALTRRLTLIQGPPGTGKTTVAGSIAFGFVHQCRNISPHCKVLASAFSNVGADNLAEKFLSLGLRVVRIGKPSGVSEALWGHTLDAAIQRDPDAQKALEQAAKSTAKINGRVGEDEKKRNRRSLSGERARRDEATAAVKASHQACNIAATKALREADVIVATSIGAADSRLLAACGIYPEEDESSCPNPNKIAEITVQPSSKFGSVRELAPDNLTPLSIPFVIIDEACQSVEPASLIPIVSTDSCRSLVMLGDPCQLPPTVRSDDSAAGTSALSVSLMSRLAAVLPQPVVITAQKDKTPLETAYLHCRPTRRAVSKVKDGSTGLSYRKQFSGALLLSVQYRMHPSIAAFSSAVFYDSLLSSPSSLGTSRHFPRELASKFSAKNPGVSVRFIQVGGRNNELKGGPKTDMLPTSSSVLDPANSSYSNEYEAERILDFLKNLLNQTAMRGSLASFQGSIGVVTPYSSQVALIKTMIGQDEQLRDLARSFPSDIEVKSVDAYQGRERDIVIFSTVRSNRDGRIGFLKDWRRMNVALTRAKNGLFVFGDAETLQEGDKHWDAFVNWCQGVGCFIEDRSPGRNT